MQEKEFSSNLSTNVLKIIACVSMFIDHVGLVFYPEQQVFRLLGRIAFPLFCYCMTVGMVYTKSIKKYLTRLLIFAFISQAAYVLAFLPEFKAGEISKLNIFITLFFSLLAVWGFKEKKYWLFILATAICVVFDFDYSALGIVLMLIFYICRNRTALGGALFIVCFLPYCYYNPIIAVIVAVLIFAKLDIKIQISKWFFYLFYPAHLLLIALVRNF